LFGGDGWLKPTTASVPADPPTRPTAAARMAVNACPSMVPCHARTVAAPISASPITAWTISVTACAELVTGFHPFTPALPS
jgi:hypothetical protein